MAKRKLPYMKMWVGDWLSSQKVMELSPMEEFCYFRLIMWAWQANASGLLNKDANLAQLCRVDMETWLSVKENVLKLFEVRGDRLFHHKVDEQVQQQQEISEKRAAAGRMGGKAKKPTNDKQVLSNCLANDTIMLKQTPKQTPYGYGSSYDSSFEDMFKEVDEEENGPRETSKIIRDFYMDRISSSDQTRTQALSHIDFVVMEKLYSPGQVAQAIDRYGQEVKASGAKMTKSCLRFFSERLYEDFLAEDWTPPDTTGTFEQLSEGDPLEALKNKASGA